MRIDDKDAWNRIKEEGLSGFSVECLMQGVEVGEIFSKQNEPEDVGSDKKSDLIDRLLSGEF